MVETSVILEAGIVAIVVITIIALGTVFFLLMQSIGKKPETDLEQLNLDRKLNRILKEIKKRKAKKKLSDREQTSEEEQLAKETEVKKEDVDTRQRKFSYVIYYQSGKQEQRQYPIVKICFTGGPCAGKTTALASCAQQLRQIGIYTLVVPEAATMLNRAGASIANANLDTPRVLRFQINLMKLQIALEDIFTEIGSDLYPEDKVVILCDRGVMDGAAYMTQPMWQALLDETGWSNTQLREKRYDMVLHLITAADGAEDYYGSESNKSRYEGLEAAIATDKKTQIVWLGHPRFSIIDNSVAGFSNKINRCIDRIFHYLGLPKANTFYKKFLLKGSQAGTSYLGDAVATFDIEVTYLQPKKGSYEEKISKRVIYHQSNRNKWKHAHIHIQLYSLRIKN